MAQLKNTTINDTGFLQLPSGNSTQRPGSPTAGMFRFNTELEYPEYFTGAFWLPLNQTPITANGGDIIEDVTINGETFRVHAFTSIGTSTFTVTEGIGEVEYLIVAGGGGGGSTPEFNSTNAGGGGAGGLVHGTINVSPQNYSLTVGQGGLGNKSSSTNNPGQNGQNSTGFEITALGGGGGGGGQPPKGNGLSGGSGGGGSGSSSSTTGGEGLQPTSENGGFGNPGGNSSGSGDSGAGGGGAGSSGSTGGGDGLYFGDKFSDNIGENGFFAGGGGGRADSSGGIGGGGDAHPSRSGTVDGSPGQANTGGGGGSGSHNDSAGGNGGSGIVLIRYRI